MRLSVVGLSDVRLSVVGLSEVRLSVVGLSDVGLRVDDLRMIGVSVVGVCCVELSVVGVRVVGVSVVVWRIFQKSIDGCYEDRTSPLEPSYKTGGRTLDSQIDDAQLVPRAQTEAESPHHGPVARIGHANLISTAQTEAGFSLRKHDSQIGNTRLMILARTGAPSPSRKQDAQTRASHCSKEDWAQSAQTAIFPRNKRAKLSWPLAKGRAAAVAREVPALSGSFRNAKPSGHHCISNQGHAEATRKHSPRSSVSHLCQVHSARI